MMRSDSSCCTCAMPCTNAPYERMTRAESRELIAPRTLLVVCCSRSRSSSCRPGKFRSRCSTGSNDSSKN